MSTETRKIFGSRESFLFLRFYDTGKEKKSEGVEVIKTVPKTSFSSTS